MRRAGGYGRRLLGQSTDAQAARVERSNLFNPETFAAFRYRDFRVLWTATFVRSAALALELVGWAVLIVELTGSAVLLGASLLALSRPRASRNRSLRTHTSSAS